MSALAPSELQARKRPFVVLGVALARAFCGFCLAYPLAALVEQSGIGQRAQGDRALFEGGGYLLLELARLQGPALMATARGLLPMLLLGLVLTAICNAVLLVTINESERLKSVGWLSLSLSCVPALCAIAVAALIAQGACMLVGALMADAVPNWLGRPQLTTALQAGAWLVALLVAGALGGLADLTRASLVRSRETLPQALARAWSCLQAQPIRACFGWVPYGLPFVAAALLAYALTGAIDVSRDGAWRVAAVFVVHQLVIVVSVAARASWFARALRLVASA